MRFSAVVLLLLIVAPFACGVIPAEAEGFSLITLREAHDLHGKPGVFFVDVNEQEIYARYHVPGARLVTSEELGKFLPADRQSTIVFYCAERRCSGSHAAAREAVKLGYKHVLVMYDGIFGWVNAGLPVERGSSR